MEVRLTPLPFHILEVLLGELLTVDFVGFLPSSLDEIGGSCREAFKHFQRLLVDQPLVITMILPFDCLQASPLVQLEKAITL